MKKIGLGGGCHWCTEAVFQSLMGVEKVEQGWIASSGENSKLSEAVVVHFREDKIDLTTLICIHLHSHSCTSKHALRSKYRSAIYYFSRDQIAVAQIALNNVQIEFDNSIITEILPFVTFKENEEMYQNYYSKNASNQFCQTYINPKLEYLMRKFSKQINPNYLKST